MHLTLSAAPKPLLLKAAAPVTPPVHGTIENFAALLGSLDIEPPQPAEAQAPLKTNKGTNPKKASEVTKPIEVEKSDISSGSPTPKKAKEENQIIEAAPEQQLGASPALPLPTVILPSPEPEVLPITFALPPAMILTPNDEAAPASNEQQAEPATVSKPGQPLAQLLPFGFAPISLPVPHVQAKAKSEARFELEPLHTLQLPLEDTPLGTPNSEIAFEAKLIPAPAPAQPNPTAPPQAPRDEIKTPDKPVPQEIKPDRPTETVAPAPNTHTAAPRPVASPDTPAITVLTPYIDKAASPAPTKQASAPAATAPDIPDLPVLKTEPARDISFRIASTPTDAVDVKLVERAGEIHVAVRSSDPVLTQSLQANVTELANKLEHAGFQAETLLPNRANPVHQPQQNPAFQDFQQERRARQQDFQPRKKRTASPISTFSLNSIQENS